MARTALALALVLAVPGATSASAAPAPWATVNVCDTAQSPNTIGIRASMPGAQRMSVRLYMRFRVQWKDPADRLWHNILRDGHTGFRALGRSKNGAGKQGGYLFPYDAPPEGEVLRLRGRVDFQWRIGTRVVRRDSALTEKGHRSAAGSDPKGYSAAICTLR